MKPLSFHASALLLGFGTLLGACQKEQEAIPQPTSTAATAAQTVFALQPIARFLQPTQGYYLFSTLGSTAIAINQGAAPNIQQEQATFAGEGFIGAPGVTRLFMCQTKLNGALRCLLTVDAAEANNLLAAGWKQVPGPLVYARTSSAPGWVPLYRLYSPARGHVFTTDATERNTFIALGYQPEPAGTVGLACYVLPLKS